MRIIIVDDQTKLRTSLRELINTNYPKASVIGEAGDITTAYDLILKQKPDVVLLDIKMPGGSGFDLIKKLMPLTFKLIFVTAYEEYAIQAFRFSALDYLLKPVSAVDLIDALQRAGQQIQLDELNMKLDNFIHNMAEASRENKKLIIKGKDTTNVININDIIRCEAADNYTYFHLTDGKKILSSQVLKIHEEALTPLGFFRSHNSHLINTAHIGTFEKSKSVLIMSDKTSVPVAFRKKDQLLTVLETI